MIKKILCSLIIGFSLISFSSAFDIPGIGLYGNSTVVVSENYDITTTWKGIDTFNGFYTEYAYNSSNIDRYGFSWIDGELYMVSFSRNGQNVYSRQGFFDSYCLADLNGTCNNFTSPISEFYLAMQNGFNSFTIYRGTTFRESLIFCFGNNTNNYCLGISPRISGNIQSSTTGDLNFDINDLTFEKFQSFNWGNSPYSSSSNIPFVPVDTVSGYDYIEVDTGDYVIMFEEKGYNKDLCYIGTTDLTSKYEDGIPYYQGSGYTIFDFYNQLYGVSSFSIHEIGVFINTWFNNYKTFFLGYNRDLDGNPINSWFYNGPGVYGLNKSNITNPFLNNLSAYYFLGSTIDFLDINEYFDGEGLATYCYKKGLISNAGNQYSIEDNHNSAIDSWAGLSARNNRLIRNQFSGVNEINSQSWDGTILDNYSGVVYTDFNSFFSDSFNRFKGFFAGIDLSDLVLGQIPSYITMFLLAIILFRFLSK